MTFYWVSQVTFTKKCLSFVSFQNFGLLLQCWNPYFSQSHKRKKKLINNLPHKSVSALLWRSSAFWEDENMTNVFHLLKGETAPLLKYLLARLQTLQLISSCDRTSVQLNSGRAVTAARSILFKSEGDICEGHYVPQTSANCHPFNMSVMLLCQVEPSGALPSPSGCRDQCSGLGVGEVVEGGE